MQVLKVLVLVYFKKKSLFILQGKALTEAQKEYVPIALELIAVICAVKKFHHFLYASHFILETDQKPLEAILSLSLNQATPRIQWILIRTFAYYFSVW